jgi:hypothetical protein
MKRTLEANLQASGVPDGWAQLDHTKPEVASAYQTVQEFQGRTKLGTLVEGLKDSTPSTYVHLRRLGRATAEWSVAKHFSSEQIIEAVSSVEVHDVGKILMPQIIEYEGVFNEQQRRLVGAHPSVGALMCERLPVECPKDSSLRRQVVAQTYSHHLRHDDERLHEAFVQAGSTTLDPNHLHKLVRTVDMLDASSNLFNRPYGLERFKKGKMPFLTQGEDGALSYVTDELITDICTWQGLPPETPVFDSTLSDMIVEFAELLPPVTPPELLNRS